MSENTKSPTINQNDAILIANALTQRRDFMDKMFDPRRDIDDECGYDKQVSDEQYRKMYDRELGARVVNVYPEETWQLMPRIFEDPDPETETEFEKALKDLDDGVGLMHYLQRADELSGVGQYGIILWGLNDGKQLSEEVAGSDAWAEATGKTQGTTTAQPSAGLGLLYMRVLDASLVRVATYESDPTKPRYGLPLTYNLTLHDPRNQESGAITTSPQASETAVHWTRVTHLADNRKTSETLGTPRMQPVWNRLYDLRKILGGSGEMYWKGGFPGISLETQPGLEDAELDEAGTRAMMDDYSNGLQRYIALTGMTAKSLSPQISDPKSTFEVQIKAMCVTLGVPYRVFMGIEEGVVSGDQATNAWNARLANRQTRYVTPMIIKPVLNRLINFGVLPTPAQPPTVEWPDLSTPSEGDRAEVASKQTDAMSKYVAGGVDSLVPPMQFLTIVMGMEEGEAEAILDAAVAHIEGHDDPDETTPAHFKTPEALTPDNTEEDDTPDDEDPPEDA